MSKLEQQIREMYNKAFYDIIDETIQSKNPDYEWIMKLYLEIKNRLIRYLKKESNVYKQIDEEFDVVLFKQMLENDVFDLESLLKLVNNTFKWVKLLQAPARDKTTEDAKSRVLSAPPEKMVSTFIKEVNFCIDLLDEDFVNFINEKKET